MSDRGDERAMLYCARSFKLSNKLATEYFKKPLKVRGQNFHAFIATSTTWCAEARRLEPQSNSSLRTYACSAYSAVVSDVERRRLRICDRSKVCTMVSGGLQSCSMACKVNAKAITPAEWRCLMLCMNSTYWSIIIDTGRSGTRKGGDGSARRVDP